MTAPPPALQVLAPGPVTHGTCVTACVIAGAAPGPGPTDKERVAEFKVDDGRLDANGGTGPLAASIAVGAGAGDPLAAGEAVGAGAGAERAVGAGVIGGTLGPGCDALALGAPVEPPRAVAWGWEGGSVVARADRRLCGIDFFCVSAVTAGGRLADRILAKSWNRPAFADDDVRCKALLDGGFTFVFVFFPVPGALKQGW